MEDIEQFFKAKMDESMDKSMNDSINDSMNDSMNELTAESNSNQTDDNNGEKLQKQPIVEPQNASSSSSILSASTSSIPNKSRKSKLSFITLQSAGKDTSMASSFIRWIFSNGLHKSNKSDQKLISVVSATTPSIPTRTTSKSTVQPLVWHYAINRHIYAEKAVAEYETVNQEYAEWCAQIANVERGNLSNGNGVISGNHGSNSTNSMAIRFPGLIVEYPKYFGNGFANSPLI